jgi:hypothetical protein
MENISKVEHAYAMSRDNITLYLYDLKPLLRIHSSYKAAFFPPLVTSKYRFDRRW